MIKDRNYMDIYSRPDTKIKFMNSGGYESQTKDAIDAGLVEGETYTVSCVDVGNWMSYVYLEEFPNKSFNTVMFDEVEEEDNND